MTCAGCRALRKLGLTPQRPLRRAWQQQPEAVDQWKHPIDPETRGRAQAEGARIDFAEEAGMRSHDHGGTTWAPAGETPVVAATGARFAVNMISAVAATGEMRLRLVEGSVNATVFADFIERLAADADGRKVFVIVDGHPSHRSRIVQRKLAELGG